METEPAVSEPIHEDRWLPFGAVLVIAFDALLIACFLPMPEGQRDPQTSITLYWAVEGIYKSCGVLALATIFCIFSRRPQALRLAIVFQRWTSITLLLALLARCMSPVEDGDQLALMLIFPVTILFVILGFSASKYLNRVSKRLAIDPTEKNLIPADTDPNAKSDCCLPEPK